MDLVVVDRLHFRFPEADSTSLAGIDWSAEPGQTHLLIGESGSGKTSFLRALNGLIPHFHGGRFGGDVWVAGLNTRKHGPRELARITGTVFQDPEAQMVTDTVEDEIVFGMENLGFPPAQMKEQLVLALDLLDIHDLRFRDIVSLSGGERQKVAIAAAIVTNPALLLLDEPTSQLDPVSASELIEAVESIQLSRGTTIVIAEHRLASLLPIASHLMLMSAGSVQHGKRDDLIQLLDDAPPLVRFGRLMGWSPPPVTVEDARTRLQADLISRLCRQTGRSRRSAASEPVIDFQRISFNYRDRPVLQDISFQACQGEIIALIGQNGSGKSTLLKLLIGLLGPASGRISISGRSTQDMPVQEIAGLVGYVPQHASALLHQETLADEVRFTIDAQSIDGDVDAILKRLRLGTLKHRHPLDLSGGERQRAAIAAIAVAQPPVLLLDEPTRGMPASDKRALGQFLTGYAAGGQVSIVATHDMDFVANFADRVLLIQDHRLEADGAPDDVLAGSPIYTTQLNRLLGNRILRLEDIDFDQALSGAPMSGALTHNQAG